MLYIPKKIHVGFQERSGTYTGKLAYVIYFDEANKLRKAASWNSWRNKKIEPITLDNVPMEGFVLNKKVGDYKSDWNHRSAYFRVYDPRDFEFEITPDNLSYIIETNDIFKGKGFDGTFVYAWEGKNLILLSTDSKEYKEINQYSELRQSAAFIKPNELVIGRTYIDKNNKGFVYMGRMNSFKMEHNFQHTVRRNQFFFYSISGGFVTYQSISNKFIGCSNLDKYYKFDELYEKLQQQPIYSPIDPAATEYVNYTLEEFTNAVINSKYMGLNIYTNDYKWVRIYSYLNKCEYSLNGSYYSRSRSSYEVTYNILKPQYRIMYLVNGQVYTSTKGNTYEPK